MSLNPEPLLTPSASESGCHSNKKSKKECLTVEPCKFKRTLDGTSYCAKLPPKTPIKTKKAKCKKVSVKPPCEKKGTAPKTKRERKKSKKAEQLEADE